MPIELVPLHILAATPDPAKRVDWGYADGYLPDMQRICGRYLITAPTLAQDMHEGADLLVAGHGHARVGCRVRRHEYLARFGEQFTIRAARPSGLPTELDKILAGWGNFLLYGFAAALGPTLCQWVLGRLDVFREWYGWYQQAYGRVPGAWYDNADGSSQLAVFDVAAVPPAFVVARQRCTPGVTDPTPLAEYYAQREALDVLAPEANAPRPAPSPWLEDAPDWAALPTRDTIPRSPAFWCATHARPLTYAEANTGRCHWCAAEAPEGGLF